jgi:hypothetical protein
MSKQSQSVMSVVVLVLGLMATGTVRAGSLDPANAPGPTMHTLEEIYQKVQNLAPQTLQTLSSNTAVVNGGYYAATNLTQVDADLVAGNIKTNVTIFGVTGTLSTNAGSSTYSTAVPKTGQTPTVPLNPAPAGSDGALQKGVAFPNPRFTDNGNGTVKDNLTGLIWLQNANVFGPKAWAHALTDCATLNSGEGGLTDGSAEGDWRLPNAKELYSLIDPACAGPALPSGHPFTGVSNNVYWSSSTYAVDAAKAWIVYSYFGFVNLSSKTITYYVWPVCGGQ